MSGIRKKKAIKLILRIILLCLIVSTLGVLAVVRYKQKQENIKISEKVVEQIIRDVYTPKGLSAFLKSKEKYTYQVMTQEVADDFYWYDGNELSEDALKRKVSVNIVHSSAEDNSSKEEIYKADVKLSYADNSVDNFTITFYVDDCGWIYSYEINANNT